MPSVPAERYDFFLSRRGSVAAIAQEVTDVLTEKGYRVFVQDYDIPISANFIEEMHEAVKNARDLVVLFTRDYEQSPYARMEFTSFEANAAQSAEKRRMIILRCEDAPLLGLFAPHVYQDLVGIGDAEERRNRILTAAEGRSQALEPPPRPFLGVPPCIASFVGRTDELDRLDAILMRDKPAAVTQASVGRAAVQGMGGVGKTSLAIEYAHRYRSLYAGVCWCPAETRTGLLSALAGLAVTLGAAKAEEADVEKSAKAALRRLAEQSATWLLVYDNVPEPKDIAQFLPSAGARVLITSRFSDWGELADDVALDVLPLDEAVALLENRAGREDAEGARKLAEALGNLPLALDHAAAYCKRTQMRFGDYAVKASSLIEFAPRGAGYPRSVAATFDLAITEAVAQNQLAEGLMAYLAHCAPERIPMALVEGAIDDEDGRREALGALAEVSLVKHDSFEDGTPSVTVHRLVQGAARARLQATLPTQSATGRMFGWLVSSTRTRAKVSNEDAVGRLIKRLLAIYPNNKDAFSTPPSWPLCAHLTPHVMAQREARGDAIAGGDWAKLLSRAGNYFHGRAAYSQAAELFRDALEVSERMLGPEDANTASMLNSLGIIFVQQGKLTEAQPLLERAAVINEKVYGSEHSETLINLNNLALLLKDRGDYVQAEQLFRRLLAIQEKVLGPEHPYTAGSLNGLAGVLGEQRRFAEAGPLLARALAIKEVILGPDHPDTAMGMRNFALLLRELGNLADARSLLERAVAIQEKVLGPEHPDTAGSLGTVLLQRGDFAEARSLYKRALMIRQKVFGSEHIETAMSLSNLGWVMKEERDFAGARPFFERALTILERALGPGHPDVKKARANLSLVSP